MSKKYIVKESGFYGGTYYEKSPKHVDTIPDAVAKPFVKPYGHQLEEVVSRSETVKSDDKK